MEEKGERERKRELLTYLYPRTNSAKKPLHGKFLVHSSPPEEYILLGFFSKHNVRWHLLPRARCLGRSSHYDCLEKRRSNYNFTREDEGPHKNKDS